MAQCLYTLISQFSKPPSKQGNEYRRYSFSTQQTEKKIVKWKLKQKKQKKERAETVLLDYNNQREECAERNDTTVKGYQNRAV